MDLNQLEGIVVDCEVKSSSGSWTIEGICDTKKIQNHHVVFIKSLKFLQALSSNEIPERLGVIVDHKVFDKSFDDNKELFSKFNLVVTTSDVSLSMCQLSKVFYEKAVALENDLLDGRQTTTAVVHPEADVAQNVFLGKNVEIKAGAVIHPGCVINSGSVVGEGTILYPNVTIYRNVKIGANTKVHSGTVIGADGFGFHFHAGVHHKIYHLGGAIIGDGVEIGANSCVDGGTFSPTVVGDGSKLDNHVQIGHNCQLGRGVIVCGHVAIGGSTRVGDFTTFGGKAGTGHDLTIGSACQIAGGALVNCDWPDKSVVGGHPARPLKEWMRGLAFVRKESLRK
jgi:UDP-3-O-[3-hydroxymyristoyl] glucosamine N-acyltransferase